MKALVVFILLQFLIFNNSLLQAQWLPTYNPPGRMINCLTVNGSNLFIGTQSDGAFLLKNNGTELWRINNGLGSSEVWAFAISGINIFAGTSLGVYRSTNNGTNWSQVNNGLTDTIIYSLAVSEDTIFAGTWGGTFSNTVYRSTDNGTNWSQVNNGLPNTYSVHSLTFSGTNIFAGTIGGVYLSMNNGTNWIQVNNGLTDPGVHVLTVSGSNIFAGSVGGAYISKNNGTNWTQVINGMPDYHSVLSFTVSGTNIFAGTSDKGVFLSTNNGTNWTQVNNGFPDTTTTVFSLAVCGANIYAGTEFSGIWQRPLSELVSVSKEVNESPKDYNLSQNYPNPFNPSTVISYSLPSASNVKLIVYNTLGQTIKVFDNSFKNSGNYSINFNASDLPSGVYFYKLEAGQFSQIKKMMLIK
jgi:Secretion system C-terminal sorting domain